MKAGATAGTRRGDRGLAQERRTKTGNKMGIIGLSDPTGQFEAVLFSEGLAQYRDLLEPGAAVLLQLGAEAAGRRCARPHPAASSRSMQAAAKTQMGLRIFLRDASRWSRSPSGWRRQRRGRRQAGSAGRQRPATARSRW